MRNILKSLFIVLGCILASSASAADATFTMASIFDGNSLSFNVTTPTAATVTSNTSKSNSKAGKLGSDGHYFEIVLASETFTAASINGFINTNDKSKNWAFQFSTDKGANWSAEVTQANDGNKTAHDIAVEVTIPAGANGFRVVRRAGTSTQVNSITLTLGGGSTTPTVSSVTVSPTSATLDINETQQLTATVDATPASADKTVTWTSSNPSVATVSESGLVTAVAQGTATITATSNLDNTKSGTCSVTVNAPAAPIPVTAISIKAATTINIGASETLAVAYTPSDANTGKALNWTSDNTNIATVDQNGKVTGIAVGTATITATSTTDASIKASCSVTVQAVAVTSVSLNKTSTSIKVGNTETLTATVLPAEATNKSLTWTSDKPNIAAVNNGVVTGVAEGTAVITVTTTDGGKTATCNVTVTEANPVPPTDLTIHTPGIYDAKLAEGGYATQLTVSGGREYELYYASRDPEGDYATLPTKPGDKQTGIEDKTKSGENACKAADGWFEAGLNSISGGTSEKAPKSGEFAAVFDEWRVGGTSVKLHIKGYDQFAFYGQDKSVEIDSKTGTFKKEQRFQVFIDGVMEPETQCSTSNTVRRYDISTGEHLIEVKGMSGGDSKFYAFSLRVAQEPKTKYLKGNDSAQVVLQTMAMRPVYYYTKYNSFGETKLTWDGPEATGFTLTKGNSDAVGDTLILSGSALCPVGAYTYHITCYQNGIEKNSVSGTLQVISKIKALTDTLPLAYTEMAIDDIRFQYYALSENDVTLTWKNGAPEGITGSDKDGKYVISGTPTTEGKYPFVISVTGGNSIEGLITVRKLDLGNDPVLYLFKNNESIDKNGVFTYLTDKGKNLIAFKAKDDGLRPTEQYGKYKWILISEDVDADNAELLAIARGEVNLPVLNMKGFSYTPDRLDWGEPDNGSLDSITDNRYNIFVQRADHPIFQSLGWKQGDKKKILTKVDRKGLMPINVDLQGTLCLATAYTRNLNNYYADGELQTILHEIPASERPNGKKYLCLPIAQASSNYLSDDGKHLLNAVVDYLLSDQQTVAIPELEITDFVIGDVVGEIDQIQNTITVELNVQKFPRESLKALTPTVTLASPLTHVEPASKEAVDFSNSISFPVEYVVSDYINRRVYNVVVRTYNPEGIDEVYSAGEWVNIYDIHGRMIATTNENIYQMALPTGMYLVVTSDGKTIKLMK